MTKNIMQIIYEGKPLSLPLSDLFVKNLPTSQGYTLEIRIDDLARQSPKERTRYVGQTHIKQISDEDSFYIDLAGSDGLDLFIESPDGSHQKFVKIISKSFIALPRTRISISLLHPDGVLLDERFIDIMMTDPALLKNYYSDKEHRKKYTTIDVFNHLFHQTRLEILRPIFRQYIKPGSIVADIGSGSSIFLAMDHPSPIRLIALDLDFPMLKEMGRRPVKGPAHDGHDEIAWVSASAMDVPLRESSLDAVYAGEIIEHVTNPDVTLAHWSALLKPGGILILTTPNRDRLSNRLSTYDRPCNPEHISEMGYDELLITLNRTDFEILRVRGIYIELFLSYWKKLKSDLLAFRMRWRVMWPLFWFLMHLGRLFPRCAFNLTIVARKKPLEPG